MSGPALTLAILGTVGLVATGLSLVVRRRAEHLGTLELGPWSSTLSYVATAYGVIVGFSIILLFGEFSDARAAVGDEATSIGTAFEEARLFPDGGEEIQHALVCYARAVPEYEWPALRDKTSAPEVDAAYRDLIESVGAVRGTEPTTFQPAAATNLMSQLGSISTARETRIVAAETQVPWLLWGFLVGGGLLVLALLFMVTLPASPGTQAGLVACAAVFTTALLLLVLGLSTPFSGGAGRVSPALIEQTSATMAAESPAIASLPCPVDAET